MLFNIFAFIVSIVYAMLYYQESVISLDQSSALSSLLVFGLVIIFYFIASYYKNKIVTTYWFNPSYIVLLGLIIVNLQTIINVLLDYAPLSSYLQTSNSDAYFNKALYASLLVITGFLIGCYNTTPYLRAYDYEKKSKQRGCNTNLSTFSVLAVAFFVLFVVNIDVMSFITGLDYENSGSYDRQSGASYMLYEQLFSSCITIIFAIVVYNAQYETTPINFFGFYRAVPKMVWLVLLVYIVLRLLSGDRGPVLYSLSAVGYAYLMTSKRRLSLALLVIVLFIGATATTILGTTRSLSKNNSFTERLEYAVNIENDEVESICQPTQELANSVNCNFIVLADLHTGRTNIQSGKYSFYNLVTCFPGSLKLLNTMFGLTQKDINSAEYITRSFFGDYYPYGLGTTTTAEGILDFGLLGCFLLNLIFGFLLKRIDILFTYTKQMSMLVVIVALKFASESIYLPRFSYTGMLSKAIYIVILFFVVNYIANKLKRRVR